MSTCIKSNSQSFFGTPSKYVIFVQLKANLVGVFSTMRKTFTNLAAMVGCHGDMVTMATVSGNLFLYSSKGITYKFRKFLSPKGSPNTSKIRQIIRRYLAVKRLIIYKYSTRFQRMALNNHFSLF